MNCKRGDPRLLLGFGGLMTSPAHAHLVETGFGEYYDGVVHFAVTPADVMVVVALALFAGLRGTRAGRYAVVGLPLAWWVAGLIGQHWGLDEPLTRLTVFSFAFVGALVALDVRVADSVVLVVAIVAGGIHGLVNGATMPGNSMLALTGAVSVALVLCLLLAAEVLRLSQPWQRVAVRVAGSWMLAIGILMLGWLVLMARNQ